MSLEILSRAPGERSRHAPLLFIHGAYLGAWCWDEYFLSWFAQHGFEAHALSQAASTEMFFTLSKILGFFANPSNLVVAFGRALGERG